MSAAPAAAGGLGQGAGDCPPHGRAKCGEPIDIASGNHFDGVTDYTTAGQNKLEFTRYYNHQQWGWTNTYVRLLSYTNSTEVDALRPDGKDIYFYASGGGWKGPANLDLKLTHSGATWTLVDWDDNLETYTQHSTAHGPQMRLASIKARNGYTQTMGYNATGQIVSVTDSYGRSLTFTYANTSDVFMPKTVTTPEGLIISYDVSWDGSTEIKKVNFSTTPATSQTYLYTQNNWGNNLTGIIDENGHRAATWTYENGNDYATSSQHAGGADLTTVKYDFTAERPRTVSNALGQQEVYKFGYVKISINNEYATVNTEIDRLATATTAAATRKFTYDANGYTASTTDWNGTLTTTVNDARGLPTKITEAAGTPQQRVTTITYHSKFHLPLKVAKPGLTTVFTYDAAGNLLKRSETDTTSASGQTRTWTFTWSNFLLASAKDPRGNTTSYAHDASGALTAVTNARGQKTRITQHTPGGLPLTIVDPNGVATHLNYDKRQRLTSETVDTAGGARTTSYIYDPAGNLTAVTLPGGARLTYTYDAANRLVRTTDLFGRRISQTLNALGDPTLTQISDAGGVTFRRSASYDALGRLKVDVRGAGQRTTYAYDANDNLTGIVAPLNRATADVFDALDRVVRITDPAHGVSTVAYDAQDQPLHITDPKGSATGYVYNGFGDVIQQLSLDTGKTTFAYDLAGNLIRQTDARGVAATNTYDALNRLTSTSYGSGSTENVAYRFDEAGAGFGVGRLTSLTDAAGTLRLTYDERGNVTREIRTIGGTSLTTRYTYDAAGRRASIIYPSGYTVAYGRDAMGQVILVTLKGPGAASSSIVVRSVTYQPFGPVKHFTYGNGVAEGATFDLAYRQVRLVTSGNATLQNLVYGYNAADDVISIKDSVNAAQSQTFAYDVLDRLTHANGAYGSIGYGYDKNGNRLTQAKTGASFTYTYGAGNRLAALKQGNTVARSFAYTANGDIAADTSAAAARHLAYNRSNRLSAVTRTGQTSTYKYDAFGQRRSAAVTGIGTTLFSYDLGGNLIEEMTGTQRFDTIYFDGRPVARLDVGSGKLYFLHDDRLGTPQLATNAAQAVVWRANYEPFGATKPTGSLNQPFRLPGQFADPTGYSHNGFRDYDPALGRYLESDPIGLGGGLNAYAYAGGNPTGTIDPSGLSPGDSIGDWVHPSLTPPFIKVEPPDLYKTLSPQGSSPLDIGKMVAAREAAKDAQRDLYKRGQDPKLCPKDKEKLKKALKELDNQINNLGKAINDALGRWGAGAMGDGLPALGIKNDWVNNPGSLGPDGQIGNPSHATHW